MQHTDCGTVGNQAHGLHLKGNGQHPSKFLRPLPQTLFIYVYLYSKLRRVDTK